MIQVNKYYRVHILMSADNLMLMKCDILKGLLYLCIQLFCNTYFNIVPDIYFIYNLISKKGKKLVLSWSMLLK